MKKKIIEICEALCCKELALDEQLILTGVMDSFKIMELICALEEEFQITFLPEEITELDNFSCINQIVDIVDKKIYDRDFGKGKSERTFSKCFE